MMVSASAGILLIVKYMAMCNYLTRRQRDRISTGQMLTQCKTRGFAWTFFPALPCHAGARVNPKAILDLAVQQDSGLDREASVYPLFSPPPCASCEYEVICTMDEQHWQRGHLS